MATTREYDEIQEELAANNNLGKLKLKILTLLKQYPEGLTRLDLIEKIFGIEARLIAETQLAKDGKDRKIRKAIEALRDDGILIEASFGRAGYRLSPGAPPPDVVNGMIAEWGSMIKKLKNRIRMARRYLPASAAAEPKSQKKHGAADIQRRMF